MGGEWTKRTLRDAGVTLIDCDHRTPPAADVGYPYVAIPQMKDGRLALDDARQISREHFLEWTRKARPTVGDVVLSRRCNPGETAYVPEGTSFALGQNLVLLRSDGTSVYPPFLRWLVQGPEWWDQVQRHLNVGAVFDSLKCADIPRFELTIPPIDAQRTISDVLSSIDQRIELNGRMSRTLEAMARALFKSWFVDFDPVRSKAEGRDPGLPEEIAKLFPDGFEESELGEIPRGWVVGSFLDHAKLLSGGTPKTDRADYWDGPIAWASAKDVSQSPSTLLVSTERTITQRGLEESATQLVPAFASAVVARGAGVSVFLCMSR